MFWQDKKNVNNIMDELNNLKEIVHNINALEKEVMDDIEYLSILELESDLDVKEKIENNLNIYEKELEQIELFTLFSGPYDKNNCILEIHAGAGGTEACDWTNMLYRMYTRFLESNNFNALFAKPILPQALIFGATPYEIEVESILPYPFEFTNAFSP